MTDQQTDFPAKCDVTYVTYKVRAADENWKSNGWGFELSQKIPDEIEKL